MPSTGERLIDTRIHDMENIKYDAIIIGGSFAGLAAGLTLGRSLRKTLIIDSGKPCNRFSAHSQNFITHDGHAPALIASDARDQLLKYDTVKFYEGLAINAQKGENGFMVETQSGKKFNSKKLILATGLKDIIPEIPGLADCWGKSVVHCPYCHGYEIRNLNTAILANGDAAFHYAPLVANLTQSITVLTNGESTLTSEQMVRLTKNNISVVEKEVVEIEQKDGQIKSVKFTDHTTIAFDAMYYGPQFEQHSTLPQQLGCALNEHGLLTVDELHRTTVEGVYACGDNSSRRFLAIAVSSGNIAGAGLNFDLANQAF